MNLQETQSMNYLVFGATCELMLDTYANTNMLKYYSPTLRNKLRNLKPDLERESKKIFDYLEKDGNEEVVKQYHGLVTVLETFLASTRSMKDLTELLNIIEQWDKGELKIIEDESK